ncbi:RNA polymerase sigma factor [Anaerocolumna sp.]|uniref:RNA polymerase sigma factor n=1 Tax=Anaerocolumna sp. TaxID=2041569 RepID=UPI0028B17558|nr:sigma-70 family RNA polymerase sigma factor [Anaerocolumna sp.]
MTADELYNLITECEKHVYSFCCNLTGSRIEADDLYQDTILKAVELRHRLDSSGNPKSYLMGISVKIWQNQKKKYAIRNNIIQMEELDENLMQNLNDISNQPESVIIRKETIHAVREGMKQLPEKMQTVLYMYYTAEMSVEDIAKTLHIPKGTVKSRLHKGRKLIKEFLEVQDYGIS